jgi:biotin carboxyl carrier protein
MEQEYIYKGETHIVNLDSDTSDFARAEAYKVNVDDTNLRLNVAAISPNSFSISFNDESKTVHVAETDDSIFVFIEGRVVQLGKVRDDAQKFSADGLEYGAKDEIKTPMPGKIVKVMVNAGDRVEVGQPLVIVESMKMENEIKSPTNGVVKAVNFAAGDLVSPNQAIINLDPDAE